MNLPPDLTIHNLPPDAMDDYELADGESANSAIYGGGYRNRLLITIQSALAPIVMEAGRAALRISLPDDGHIRVGETPKSRQFEFTADGNNAWTLAPKSRFAFDAKRSIRFNLLGVTIEGEIAGQLQVDPLGLSGGRIPRRSAPGRAQAETGSPRFEPQGLDRGAPGGVFRKRGLREAQERPLSGGRSPTHERVSERIEVLPADWHVRIFAGYGYS